MPKPFCKLTKCPEPIFLSSRAFLIFSIVSIESILKMEVIFAGLSRMKKSFES